MGKKEIEERKKVSKLAKILGKVAIGVILVSQCGCQSIAYQRTKETKVFEKRFDEKDFMNYPEYLKGTRMDPYPPARIGD